MQLRRLALLAPAVIASILRAAAPVAFPGAEGFGAGASGGRGASVFQVINLNDAGPGSLRDAVSGGDRTVVFCVSGTIDLKSRLDLRASNVTIAGQTAPGDGICLKGRELMIVDAQNVIVRFVRIRPGDEQKAEHDALSIRNSRDVIVDHCSMSWSTDSVNDVTHGSGNVTVQWCIISEPLNSSVHVKGAHGYGTGWGGHVKGGSSYHHNLIAHCESRAPRIGYMKGQRGLIDCRNNVIYNTGGGSAYGAEGCDLNYVGNYHVPGPATKRPEVLFDIWAGDTRAYVADNRVAGNDAINTDNARGMTFKEGSAETCLVRAPFAAPPGAPESAQDVRARVLAFAGAVLPRRDVVDERIVADVKNRTGTIINSQADVGGWPELKSTPAPADSDRDGMPDAWEESHNLNPADPADGAKLAVGAVYTNLEVYLNELAKLR